MPARVLRWVALSCVAAVMGVPCAAYAKPITTIGGLANYDPNHPGDLPKSLAGADPNAVIIARDTLLVIPPMFLTMETVILNLTEGGTRIRLDELYESVLPDSKQGRGEAAPLVHAFVIGQIAKGLAENHVKIDTSELEGLVSAVKAGPAKDFVADLAKQGPDLALDQLMERVEKSTADVRSFFRPTVLAHLESGHMGLLRRIFSGEEADPWSIQLGALVEAAKTQRKPVQDFVAALPVWLMHYRTEREAPDVPLSQLMEMLAGSRAAYAKMVPRPLANEKDLDAPGKVGYMLQEAYARSEQIHTDLTGRNVIGVVFVGTLLVLLAALVGYIRVLDIPNRRIVEK